MIQARDLARLSAIGSACLLSSTLTANAAPSATFDRAGSDEPLPIEKVYCDRNPLHHGGVYDRFGCWHPINHGYCDRRFHHGGFYVRGCWFP